jgi:hypothetical protein
MIYQSKWQRGRLRTKCDADRSAFLKAMAVTDWLSPNGIITGIQSNGNVTGFHLRMNKKSEIASLNSKWQSLESKAPFSEYS